MGRDGEEAKLGPAQSVYVDAFYIDQEGGPCALSLL